MANKKECLLQTGLSEIDVNEAFPNDVPTSKEAQQAEIKANRELATGARRKAKINEDIGLKIDKHIEDYIAKGGTEEQAIRSLLVKDRFEKSGMVGAEQRKKTILGQVHAKLVDAFDQFRPTKFGFRHDTKGVENMALEIHGKNTGDAQAAHNAKAWREATEYLRERYNRAGGNIKANEDWGTPQSHSSPKIREASQEEWIAYVMERIDRNKMVDFKTNKPLQLDELEELLTNMNNKIVSGGYTKKAETLADKHGRQRILHFKDADSWLEYQQKFGADSLWGSMTDHLDVMARDISLMETLGTDPDGLINRLIEAADSKIDATPASELGTVNRAKRKTFLANTKATYDLMRQSNSDINPNLNNIFGLPRNLATAMLLPASAPISALTDSAYMAITKKYLGLPVFKNLGSYIRQLKGQISAGSAEARMASVKLGLTAEYALDRTLTAMRFADAAAESGSKVAERAMRASLLTAHTVASRQSFGMDFLSSLSDMSNKSWDELNSGVKATFDRYGIDAADWDHARRAKKYHMDSNHNAKYMNPLNMDEARQVKFGGMVEAEMDIAVPTPDSASRAAAAFGTQSGTLGGEALRTVMQFKSFPVTVAMTQWSRIAYGNGFEKAGSRAAYIASAIGMTSALGLIVLQIKDILKGKEPREFTGDATKDGKLLWDAMNQGGSLSLIGDFIDKAMGTRYNSDPAELFVPPAFDLFAGDVLGSLLVGNVYNAATGEDTSVVKDAVNIAKKTPGFNMWYAKLAMDRMVWDQANDAADRDWSRNERRKEREMRRKTEQQYWWKPGDITPTE